MFLLLASLAHAQAVPDEVIDGHRVLRQKVTTIDFEGQHVDALPDKPSGALVVEIRHERGPSFITLRESFVEEMDQSVDEVK